MGIEPRNGDELQFTPSGNLIFYDGQCGLCHGFVRFVLAQDRSAHFRFAPLQGETFEARVPAASRVGLPDSVVVITGAGKLLTRSEGVLYVFSQLGPVWRWIGKVAELIPSPIRDVAYNAVAAVRRRLFQRPSDICPVVRPELRARFEK